MSNLFQDQKTGKLVEFINKHDKEYAMVRDSGGNINYVNLDSLVPYDKQKGRLTGLLNYECHYQANVLAILNS